MEPELSIVIPTYNEVANIETLLRQLAEALPDTNYEAVVVDDDSRDGTAEAARSIPGTRVIVRTTERGLATAVIEGIRQARGKNVAVMDADLQHPPAMIAKMLAQARDGADLVIGSRYVEGGSDGAFSTVRRVVSRGARAIGKIALPPLRKFKLTDPMSGLFMVRRDAVDTEALRPVGYKILLEIIGRSELKDVREVGFEFGKRHGGESKLGAAVMVQYLAHLAALAVSDKENRRLARFAAVGASGVIVNLLTLWALTEKVGWHYFASALVAIELSILSNFFLNDRFTFGDLRSGSLLGRLARFNAVSIGALTVNIVVLVALTELLHVHYLISEAIAIVAAFAANYSGNTQWTYGGFDRFRMRDVIGRAKDSAGVWLPTLVLTVTALGVYADGLGDIEEVYFDEHYYVSVARQIDNGVWHDPCWENTDVAPRPLNYEHPPLAKLIIAWSVSNFDSDHSVFEGCREPDSASYQSFTATLLARGDPVSWRMPGAVMGALAVGAIAIVGRRLLGSPGDWLAGGFLLADVMMVSSARTAILDIYAAGFATMALAAACFPRKRAIILSGIFLGLGFASKYSVLFVGIPAVLVAVYAHKQAGILTRRRFDGILAALILIPLLVWLITYTPWLRLWIPEMGFIGAFVHLYDTTFEALKWMAVGKQDHAYASAPAQWIRIERPMLYYAGTLGDGWAREVYAFGNLVVWWTALVTIVAGFMQAVWQESLAKVKQVIANNAGVAVALAIPVIIYGSFFLITRTAFIFYMTIVSPGLALAAAAGATKLAQSGIVGRAVAVVWIGLAILGFAWYYPAASGALIQEGALQQIKDSIPGSRW